MTFPQLKNIPAILSITLLILFPAGSGAQEAASRERIDVSVGDVFEILAVHDLPETRHTWILTQDRTFIQASQSRSFRTRIVEPGEYLLTAEVVSGSPATRLRKLIRIVAAARGESGENLQTNGGRLLSYEPQPNSDGRIVLPPESNILRLIPGPHENRPLSLDLDVATDADGDGDPGNDVQNQDTYFQSDETPLYLWFAGDFAQRTIGIVTIGENGGAESERMEVLSHSFAEANGLLTSSVEIKATQMVGAKYEFSAVFDGALASNSSPLYQWEFGDGTKSLQTRPIHEFAAPGSYDVSLRVQNLYTGKQMASATETVTVEVATDPSISSASTSIAPIDPGDTDNPSGGPSWLFLIVIFGGSLLLGAVAVWLLSKLRKGGSIQQTLETMEGKLANDGKVGPVEPLKIGSGTDNTTPEEKKSPSAPTPEQVSERERNQAGAPSLATTPAVDTSKAPSWLTKGLVGDAAAAPTPTKPVEPPKQTPPVQPAPLTPKPAPPPMPPAPAPSGGAVPSWLQTQGTPAAPATPLAPPAQKTPEPVKAPIPAPAASVAAASMPTPQAPVAPKAPTPTPTPPPPPMPPAPKPASTPSPAVPIQGNGPVPSWLQTPSTPSAPQTPSAPVTPKAPESVKTPTPELPKTSPAPAAPSAPKPITPPVPKPTPAPVATSAPVEQKPVTSTPVAPPAPKPIAPPAPAVPVQAPKSPVPPAPLATPVAPAIPAVPVQPKPVEAPKPAPVPPPMPPAPKPSEPVKPSTPDVSKVSPAAPTPVTPTPVTPKVPAVPPTTAVPSPLQPTPAPTTPSANPAPQPVTPPAPKPAPAVVSAAPAPGSPVPPPLPSWLQIPEEPTSGPKGNDEPIAIIRAESLNPPSPPSEPKKA